MLVESQLIFAAEKALQSIDPTLPGSYRLGFINFEIHCIPDYQINMAMISVATFTRQQILNGFNASTWFQLDADLRKTYRQLLKCKNP